MRSINEPIYYCHRKNTEAKPRRYCTSPLNNLIFPPSMFEHLFIIAVCLILLSSIAESVTVPWGDYCGTDHMKTYKRKQCHPIKFYHSTCRSEGASEAKHELFEFRNEYTYLNWIKVEATQLKELTLPSEVTDPVFLVGGDDYKTVTRYFGCDGDHASGDGVRASVKTNPDFVQRFQGYRCGSRNPTRTQRFRGRKNEKKCKKLCEKRNGCIGYEYHFRRVRRRGRIVRMNTCKTYNGPYYPDRGRRNRYSTCAIARKSCIEAPGA